MRTGRGPIGVIGIDDDKTGPLLTPDQRRLLDARLRSRLAEVRRHREVVEVGPVDRRLAVEALEPIAAH